MTTITLDYGPGANFRKWMYEKYGSSVDRDQDIWNRESKDIGAIVYFAKYYHPRFLPSYLVFSNEKDYTIFLLRWAGND